jgi:hypothetical protein
LASVPFGFVLVRVRVRGNPEFLVEKSHFLFPFPGQKATISWKIPGIKRGFTVKLAVFVSRMKNNPQFYEKNKNT